MQTLRPFQIEALAALERHPHVLAIAPPGSGKSLIFMEFIRRHPNARALVITPLTALARQHERDLNDSGLTGRFQIRSPESVFRTSPLGPTDLAEITFLVVDECHCIWEWGEGFRPAFSNIPELGRKVGKTLWLTATAPRVAAGDLTARLGSLVRIGGHRPQSNLVIAKQEVPWPNRADFAAAWVGLQSGSGVIFVMARTETLRVARLLTAQGLPAVAYHAGLSREEKLGIEQRLAQDTMRTILVATTAYGLGMNEHRLEWSLLWQALPSVLAIVQALGRVGRTSRVDRGLLLWHEDDLKLLDWTNTNVKRAEELQCVGRLLRDEGCFHSAAASYFEGERAPPCQLWCDWCRSQDRRDVVHH